jgi:hypothetical protein
LTYDALAEGMKTTTAAISSGFPVGQLDYPRPVLATHEGCVCGCTGQKSEAWFVTLYTGDIDDHAGIAFLHLKKNFSSQIKTT